MAYAPYTLLDVAERNGDRIAAIIEDVTIAAPEWGLIPTIVKDGTSYDILRRVGLPHGRFRDVGDGVPILKSEWARETKPMFYFDCQMRIGQDIVAAQTDQAKSNVGDILQDEASANVRGSAMYFGLQFYYGQSFDGKGFLGLNSLVSDSLAVSGVNPQDIDAGGTAGSTSSAYLVYLDDSQTSPQGLHFAVGKYGKMEFGEWMRLQSVVGQDSANHFKYRTDWTNAFEFYLGLAVGSKSAVYRVKNIDLTHPLTDALAARLLASIPVARRMNLRWLMNRTTAYTLQQSRSATTLTINTPGVPMGGVYAAQPTELSGYPIVVTDSLLSTETNGVAALPDNTDDIR